MQQSTHLGFNLPELADQYNLDHWNENTEKLDELLYEEQQKTIVITNQEIDDIMNS